MLVDCIVIKQILILNTSAVSVNLSEIIMELRSQ
jgi:hypothetical protein